MSDFLFYILATMLVILSLLAVSVPNLLHGAISLIGSFFVTAALYIMLQLEFVALSQVMLYIGGIVIFMLIIILLTTGLGTEDTRNRIRLSQRINKALVSIGLLYALLTFIHKTPSKLLESATHRADPVTMDDIGIRLLSTENGFIIPFEVISILLLVALVGAVIIARKDKEKGEQV